MMGAGLDERTVIGLRVEDPLDHHSGHVASEGVDVSGIGQSYDMPQLPLIIPRLIIQKNKIKFSRQIVRKRIV